MRTNRRKFLIGCCSAVAAMSGARIRSVVLGGAPNYDNPETLVIVFLRGGMDGLNLVPPIDGPDRGYYEAFRPTLKIPTTGIGAALPLDAQFGLHPSAAPLHGLYQAKKLAVIHGVGSAGSRSHFEAQEFMEMGTPGEHTIGSGWLTRHLQTAPSFPHLIQMPSLAAADSPPTSLAASTETLTMAAPSSFNLSQIGHSSWRYSEQRVALRQLYDAGKTDVHEAGIQALNAADLIEAYVTNTYTPRQGVVYPNNSFGNQLKMIAQMIKLRVGLRVATIDFGGWDTHNEQGPGSTGYFATQVATLAQGMAALYQDLDDSGADPLSRGLTMAVQSEFGRRVRENGDNGTDHGTALPMLVLGGSVVGGMHGQWPGLAHEQLYDNADLRPTVDYRQVLSELLIRRFGNPFLGQVFPGYSGYRPLGIVRGEDLDPVYSLEAPRRPEGFAATALSSRLILVEWQSVDTAASYQLERREGESGEWMPLSTLEGKVRQYEDADLVDGKIYYYRVRAMNSGGVSPFSEIITAQNRSALEQWRLENFGTALDAGEAANHKDLAGDGLSNLAKYALGLDPRVPVRHFTTGFSPGRPRIVSAAEEISLVYVRPLSRPGVRYQVRVSEDLIHWQPVADRQDAQQGAVERRIATVSLENGARKRFMDLQISLP